MRKVVPLLLAVCLVLLPLLAGSHAQTPSPAEQLIGLWASELKFPPALRGELTITRVGSGWRATLGGAETTFKASGREIRFAFPGEQGKFRGALTDGGRAIEGFWLQPVGGTKDRRDPGGSGQPFASPLVLSRNGRDAWRGPVRPLEGSFTLYLKIFKNENGILVGAFRNPEMNSTGGASRLRVTQEGDAVSFGLPAAEGEPEIRYNAEFLRTPDRLRLQWPDLGYTVELTRRAPEEVPAFFPRPPGATPYVYRAPASDADGWTTARARDAGLDEEALARLVQKLIDADPAARRPSLIHSILIARRGKLVLEEYFYGFSRERQHDMRSAGKTFGSIMLGTAMRRGVKLSPETRVYDLLGGVNSYANPDARKAQITLAHLMTHTSGLACDDNDNDSPGNEGTMQMQNREPNWWKYTLDLPVAHDPGSRYAYCSANSNLVGAALTTATRTWLPEWFERTIARPLSFGHYYWNLMPTDEGYLGGGAFVRPRDLLKLGQLYVDGGVWKGKRIVDSSWVALSTAQHALITEATTGLTEEQFPNFYGKGADGYAWHLNQTTSGGRTFREYEASGNGGQLLIVIPELELTVVFTGGNFMQGGIWGRWREQIVGDEIIPAIKR